MSLRERGTDASELARYSVSLSPETPVDPRAHPPTPPPRLERLVRPRLRARSARSRPASTPDPPRAPPMYPHAARLGGGSVEPVSGRANSSGIRLCAMFPPSIRLFDVSADTRPQSGPDTGVVSGPFSVRLFRARLDSPPVPPRHRRNEIGSYRHTHLEGEARYSPLHITSRNAARRNLLGAFRRHDVPAGRCRYLLASVKWPHRAILVARSLKRGDSNK
jgi:hypothetical protein